MWQDSNSLSASSSLNNRLCIFSALFGFAAAWMSCKLGLFLSLSHLSHTWGGNIFLAVQYLLQLQSAFIHLMSPQLSEWIGLSLMVTCRPMHREGDRADAKLHMSACLQCTLACFFPHMSSGIALSLYCSVACVLPACRESLQREYNLPQLCSVYPR